jgi:hypothetical protein
VTILRGKISNTNTSLAGFAAVPLTLLANRVKEGCHLNPGPCIVFLPGQRCSLSYCTRVTGMVRPWCEGSGKEVRIASGDGKQATDPRIRTKDRDKAMWRLAARINIMDQIAVSRLNQNIQKILSWPAHLHLPPLSIHYHLGAASASG